MDFTSTRLADTDFFHILEIIENRSGSLDNAEEGVFGNKDLQRGFFFDHLIQSADEG